MSISIGPGIVVGRRGIRLSGGGAAVDWWLSGGISAANAVAVYQPIGAASLAASYVNLANPGTYDAAPGTAPTFDAATGWTFNGSTQWLDTGVVVTSSYSVVVRFSNWTDTSGVILIGNIDSIAYGGYFICPNRFTAVRANMGSTGGPSLSGVGFNAGVAALSGGAFYKDNTSLGAIATGSASMSLGMAIGAGRASGGGALYSASKIQAVAIYNTTLTADQVAAVSTAMAAL